MILVGHIQADKYVEMKDWVETMYPNATVSLYVINPFMVRAPSSQQTAGFCITYTDETLPMACSLVWGMYIKKTNEK